MLELDINIDGLPLSKSSSSQVYPILCKLKATRCVDMIGIYHGYEKPSDANNFLEPFVLELIDIINNNIVINGHTYTVRINSFICDAPAKSFITYTKGHSGYASCTKCKIEGDYICNRICFIEIDTNNLRTDQDFRLKVQEGHHNGTSILENIPNIDMVKCFPLDYMHLVCLGVMKKLLVLWCYGKPCTKLSFHVISKISESLLNLSNHVPLEFNRRPRSLNEKTKPLRQYQHLGLMVNIANGHHISKKKITIAIKKSDSSDPKWPRHKIKIFRNGTFDDYGKARQKARLAEDFSDLNSGAESTAGKRKRVQKNSFKSLSESMDMSVMSSQPNFEETVDSDFQVTPSVANAQISNKSPINLQCTSSVRKAQMSNKLPMNIQCTPSVLKGQVPNKSLVSSINAETDKLAVNSPQDANSHRPSNCCLQHENAILFEIKNQNHMIRNILIDVLQEIRELKSVNPTESNAVNSIFIKYADINFPIGTDNEMEIFEEALKNEANFTEAVDELARFGGANIYNFIKRILSALIKDTVLINYSWLGRKGKKPLEKSPVAKVLILKV
ncbi:hypothetical protein NQ317_007175 [Molorchus minor]|uniref:DUF4806 domain-containing protein n=1 Tax=Molorchus minor TaxID=1323400 RepID=A0ABQ9IWF7_9CUCU|nr:hypothetical protein NQ317_007175 [Molorchus minor]